MSSEENGMAAVLRRVQKLLAMANDERGNANEAANAAQMAERLMRKYQLDHADVIREELKKKGSLSTSYVFANMKRDDPSRPPLQRNPSWGQHLGVAVAKLNNCEVRQSFDMNKHGKGEASLQFCGYSADVQVSCWMFDYLVGATIAAVKQFNAALRTAGESNKADSHAFRTGFMTTLTARIYAAAEEKEAAGQGRIALDDDALNDPDCEEPPTSASTALMLVDAKKKAIEEHFGEFKYKTSRQTMNGSTSSYVHGMREARKVDLNTRGVGGPTGARQRLT